MMLSAGYLKAQSFKEHIMASVTQCDVCGNVMKNNEAMWIEARRCNHDGTAGSKLYGKDLCPECYKKLTKLLKVEEK